MPSRWEAATRSWRRKVLHYPLPTLMYRNFRLPCTIELQPVSLMPLKMRKVQRRQRTRAFTELQSHYRFEDRFGRPGRGNDKGKVEGMVGYVRRNFLVPVPRVESFQALNAHLEKHCLERMDATRTHRDHRPADGAGPGCPAALARRALRRRRPAGHVPRQFVVPGEIPYQ